MGPVLVKKGTHLHNQGSRIISCLNEENIIEPISSFVFQFSACEGTVNIYGVTEPVFWIAVRVNFPWYWSTGSEGSFNHAGEGGQSKILMKIFQINGSRCTLNIDWSPRAQIINRKLIIPI